MIDSTKLAMKLSHISGRHRIFLSMVLASAAIVSLVAVALAHSNKLLDTAAAQWRGRLAASLIPTQGFLSAWVEDRFADAREAAHAIAASSTVQHSHTTGSTQTDISVDDSLVQFIALNTRRSGFRGLWVVDTNGVTLTSEGGMTPLPNEIAAARGAARTLTEFVSGPTVDSTGRARVAIMTPVPVRHLSLVFIYDAGQTLFPLLMNERGAERTIRTKIISADTAGFHVLSPSAYPSFEALGRLIARDDAPLAWQRAVTGTDTTGVFTDLDGHKIIAATASVAAAKWGLVRAIDESEALAAARESFQHECWVGLSLLVISALICVAVYRDVRKREGIEALERRARESAEEHRRIVQMRDEMERQVTLRTSELRAALKAAESASRAKSDFLARMSHELRTPLNSVIGFANVLTKNKAGNLSAQDVSYIERIGANGKHLLSLINSILDLAKIESGRMERELTNVHVGSLVREVVEQLEVVLRDRPVILQADVPARVASIRSDETKLRQVLMNLVGNAAKFTERGSITVCVTTDPHTDRPCRIEVKDTGIGIPANRLQAIFKPFEQADNSMTRQYGGTGLGLAITWSLCELLNAHLTVESTIGLGSTFTVHLDSGAEQEVHDTVPEPERGLTPAPLASLQMANLPTPPPAVPGRQRLVLMIDDDDDSRVVLRQYIESEGYRVVEASSGKEGVRLAATLAPDLITLDLIMPDMDGWEVLHHLKGDVRLQHIPVVIVSIVARENRGSLFGMVDLLDKPCTHDTLRATLQRNLSQSATRLLLVEDNADMQTVMLQHLQSWPNLEVRTADNGVTALQVLGGFIPDLILLDLMMPGMDGVTFLTHIRNDPRYAQIRVVVVTAQELSGAERSALDAQTLAIVEKGERFRGQLEQIFHEIGLHLSAKDLPG